MPILWNYKLNDEGTEGEIAGRSMNFGELTDFAKNGAPKGSKDYDRKRCVYDSGKVVMTQMEIKYRLKYQIISLMEHSQHMITIMIRGSKQYIARI